MTLAGKGCLPSLAIVFLLLAQFKGHGQGKKGKEGEFAHSSATDFYDAAKYERSKEKPVKIIYTTRPDEVLIGNDCVDLFTRDLGFSYAYPFDEPGAVRNDFKILAHNFFTGIGLTFRNGLGWRRKVRRQISQCRVSSGDDAT